MNKKLSIRSRSDLEQLEEATLAPYASHSVLAAATRLHDEEPHPYRTAFQRDRDRIIHSRAFRRLKHKRQVFLTDEGDHYRTRLTHTLEVSQLARTVAKALGLNEELVEAIALGHDLGHTPFGHVGEIVLGRIMSGEDDLDNTLTGANWGGFKHNYQSLRVVDHIEQKYEHKGLNLTAPVREGILKHTLLKQKAVHYPDLETNGLHMNQDVASTLEGQVVAICDEIAQHTHDLEDGLRANFVDANEIRKVSLIKNVEKQLDIYALLKNNPFLYRNLLINGLINYLITDILHTSLANLQDIDVLDRESFFFSRLIVRFSDTVEPLHSELDEFIDDEIIYHASVYRADDVATETLRGLFKFYYRTSAELPEYVLSRLERSDVDKAGPAFVRAICDHIAGMTDNFAENEYDRVETLLRSSQDPGTPHA